MGICTIFENFASCNWRSSSSNFIYFILLYFIFLLFYYFYFFIFYYFFLLFIIYYLFIFFVFQKKVTEEVIFLSIWMVQTNKKKFFSIDFQFFIFSLLLKISKWNIGQYKLAQV